MMINKPLLPVTGSQIKAGRALAGFEQKKFAELVGIDAKTLYRIESQRGKVNGNPDKLARIIDLLDSAGVAFQFPDIEHPKGYGVRLK